MTRARTWRDGVAAQARLLTAILAGSGRARRLGPQVRVEETTLGGASATVYRPGRRGGAHPAVLVVPGVTRRGRAHPGFVGVGRGLAAAGFLVAVVEPPGLSIGELTPASVEHTSGAGAELTSWPDVRDGRVALAGVSGGATLALVAAAAPEVAGRVSAVAALAPCCDSREALRVVTTGHYRDTRFETGPFFRLVLARSAVAWLRESPARRKLREHVLGLEDYGEEPLRAFRSWPLDDLDPRARAVVGLLGNDDPNRFESLYAELTEEHRRAADLLSPLLIAPRIAAPVELVVARKDKYIPLADAAAFAGACPLARLTIVDALEHAVPSASPAAARDLARLDAAAVRFLAASYSG